MGKSQVAITALQNELAELQQKYLATQDQSLRIRASEIRREITALRADG